MRQLFKTLSAFLLILAISADIVLAQKDTTVLNQSVEVMKAYHPSISNARKISLMPVIEDTTRYSPEFIYSITSKPVRSGFAASPIKSADLNKESYKDLGIGYLKLGAGTSATAYGEFFLNLPQSKNATFGLHLRHLSSDGQIKLLAGDKVDAPYSQNNAAISSSLNIGSTILTTDLTYDRDAVRYYGYPASIPAKIDTISSIHYGLKQAYEKGELKVALKSTEKTQGNLTFNSGIRLGFFDSKTGQKENSGGVFGKFDYNFGQVHGILDLSYDHYSTDSITLDKTHLPGTKSEDWIRIAPSVRLDGQGWSLRGGINVVSASEKPDGSTLKMYPDFDFNFRPLEGILTLYAGFKGDLTNNCYSDIVVENYWADPRHNIQNTDYTYVISGGLKGKISRELSYNLGVKYSQVKNLYFYVQNSYFTSASIPLIYSNEFGVVYDNAKITDFSAEFSYLSGKDLSVVLKGNYYNYKLDGLTFAPQKPNFDLSASAGMRILDKLTGFADLDVIGNRTAKVFNISPLASPVSRDQVIQIDPSICINLGVTYELSRNLRLFGRVDNLLNRPNEQWLGYASQGLRLMGGATISF